MIAESAAQHTNVREYLAHLQAPWAHLPSLHTRGIKVAKLSTHAESACGNESLGALLLQSRSYLIPDLRQGPCPFLCRRQ